MDKNPKTSGKTVLITPSTALLNQKLGTAPAPRMLTASEIELLWRSKREIRDSLLPKAPPPRSRRDGLDTELPH